jgi:hypothetical protein
MKKNGITRTDKKTLLKGEGINQHTLYGDFAVAEAVPQFAQINVLKDSVLRHEQPDGSFSKEHKALKVEKGDWRMGKQVEFNPFEQTISQIWD